MKDRLGKAAIDRLASALHGADASFDKKGFARAANRGLAPLELKARVHHIVEALREFLPGTVKSALPMLRRVKKQWPPFKAEASSKPIIGGFAAWPLIEWVPAVGLDDPKSGLEALRVLTGLFSAEFAIRPFIETHYATTLAHLQRWVEDPNEHVRRLVSEGTRPRLPWGSVLHCFVDDPSDAIELLAALRQDSHEYVRRSVANHLNDISKDHPKLTVKTAKAWAKGADTNGTRLVKHALRTLIKRGDPGALSVLGFTSTPDVKASLKAGPAKLKLGGHLELDIKVRSTAKKSQKLVIDYAVHFQKARGGTQPKVFKARIVELAAQETVEFTKRQPITPISTRKYYPGLHTVDLLVGGQRVASASFELLC